jgi:branched-chain amino acid transport system substrate-binding protein
MFRTCFTDSQQGKAMAVFAYKTQLYKKTGVLLDLNDQITYRRDLGRAFAAAFKKLSGENVEEMGYISGTDNFVPQMMRFRQTETAAIFAPSDIPDAGIIIKQARKCGVRKVLLGSDGWDHTELFNYCGSRPEPCYITSMFSAESDLPGVKEFVRSVKARTGKTPNTDTAQAYDTMNIVVKALKLAHSPNDIRSGLYKIGNYPGVTGKISINAQGDAVKTIFIKKIVKKKTGEFGFELIKIISPEDI